MNIYRLKTWTHHEPKHPKGEPEFFSANFEAPPGEHAVMLNLSNVREGEVLNEELLGQMLKDLGLALVDGEIFQEEVFEVTQWPRK